MFAAILGKVDWDGVHDADWIGFPDFTTPSFTWHAIILIVPAVILVLIAENAAHVKAVAAMTERDLDPLIGRSIAADGAATTLAGMFGGSGTTTYAENIGVMGLTRVYSTLAYIIAGGFAIALALLPKFGAIISAIPIGVLGGAVTVLFGLIAVLGARIWIEAKVDFRDPVNLAAAGVAPDRRRRRLHAQLGRLHVRRHHARHHRRGRHLPGAQAAERRNAFPSHGPSAKPGAPMRTCSDAVPALKLDVHRVAGEVAEHQQLVAVQRARERVDALVVGEQHREVPVAIDRQRVAQLDQPAVVVEDGVRVRDARPRALISTWLGLAAIHGSPGGEAGVRARVPLHRRAGVVAAHRTAARAARRRVTRRPPPPRRSGSKTRCRGSPRWC